MEPTVLRTACTCIRGVLRRILRNLGRNPEFFCCVFLRVTVRFPEGFFSRIFWGDLASCLPGRTFVCCGACWYLCLSQRGLI